MSSRQMKTKSLQMETLTLLTITFCMRNQSLAILYLISLRISVTSIISSNKMLMKAWKSPRSQIRVTMMVGAHGYGKKVN